MNMEDDALYIVFSASRTVASTILITPHYIIDVAVLLYVYGNKQIMFICKSFVGSSRSVANCVKALKAYVFQTYVPNRKFLCRRGC